MKKTRFLIEYLLLRLLGYCFRIMPRSMVVSLGKWAGSFIYYCIPVRKKITLENLRNAYPEKSEKALALIARKAYQTLVQNGLEHLCLAFMRPEDLLEIVEFKNEEILKKAYARGKGVIIVGGHFGNWEYSGAAITSKGYPLTYIIAKIANPYINDAVNEHRQKMGIGILAKGMSVRGILKTLKNEDGMAMLVDQDSGKNGVFVTYFNRPCSTPKGPALFSLKTGAALVFVAGIRNENGTVTVQCEEIDVDYSLGGSDENIAQIMQSCTSLLEKYVRKYPGQWLWMHRRWKTRAGDKADD